HDNSEGLIAIPRWRAERLSQGGRLKPRRPTGSRTHCLAASWPILRLMNQAWADSCNRWLVFMSPRTRCYDLQYYQAPAYRPAAASVKVRPDSREKTRRIPRPAPPPTVRGPRAVTRPPRAA